MKQSKNAENHSQKNPEFEEIELIRRLKEGNHKDFEALYYLYKTQLLRFLVKKF
jgi:hypothetical protein